MKTKKYYLVLAVSTGILCIWVPAKRGPSALGQIELPLNHDKPFLIGRAYPTLADIEELYVDIMPRVAEPNQHLLIWKEIGTKVKHKIIEAGIKVANANEGGYTRRILFIPQLRVDVDMITLDNSEQCVFRTQTSLSRAVRLRKQREPFYLFKADVWKVQPVMQVASVHSMPTVVSNKVLQQVEAFIQAYIEANPPGKQAAGAKTGNTVSPTSPKEVSKRPAEQAVAKYKYVASKNSEVFHKPECRWAKKISPKNLVGYNSTDEATKAGKRPCKLCKP